MTTSFNGSCNQLWKERHEQCITDEILLCLDILSIYINDIAQRLKGIKRNPDRKYNIETACFHMNPKYRNDCCHTVMQKIEILKENQNPQIGQNSCKQHCLTSSLLFSRKHINSQSTQICNHCRRQNQQCILRIPSHVKIVAGKQKPYLPCLFG